MAGGIHDLFWLFAGIFGKGDMASDKLIRGTTNGQEIRQDHIVRDTRSGMKKAGDWLHGPGNLATVILVMAIVSFAYPGLSDLCLVVAGLLTWFGLTRVETAPLKLPVQAQMLDQHEPHPATNAPMKANGIFFMGNELRTGKEVWLTNSDCRQHFLVLGTTGAGKTEALLGFAANAIAWGSGFLFCDGKGDVALFAKVFALCARFNRLDDLLVLNYMTGNRDVGASGGKLRSNTLNPFATGSSDTMTQMVVGLMDDAGGDGAMWKGRAAAMFTGVMRALTWLRDNHIVDLNVAEIRDHLNLRKIIDLADQAKYKEMPQPIRKSIRSYLTSLPGYQEDKHYKQAQTTLDQHGYLEMQFTKILGSLADVYGHIFSTPYGEIDMADVVLNRRILVIMLPALEKATDEIANLGKIVVATLKGMMGGTLGSEVEGTWEAVVENRPTNSPSPFIVVLDEVGYYMVDGMDLMSAQARSLGFALVFAGQDINAMKRLNEKVFGSVQGNTNTKIIMRTEDPETAKIAVDAGGKAYRAHMGGYEGAAKEIQSRAYTDNMNAQLTEVDRINPLDLKAQGEGEMHLIHKEYVIRLKSFYANPEGAVNTKNLRLRPNHFITVEKPDAEDIAKDQRAPEILAMFLNKDWAKSRRIEAENDMKNEKLTDELGVMVKTIDDVRNSKKRPNSQIEAVGVIFARLYQQQKAINEAAGAEIRGRAGGPGAGSRARFAEGAGGPPRAQNQSRKQLQGVQEYPEGDDGVDFVGEVDRGRYQEPVTQQSRARAPARRPTVRQVNPGRVRANVDHGVQIGSNEIHDMADKIATSDSVMKTLSALNFEPVKETRETVQEKIEQAAFTSADGFDRPDDYSVFDADDAVKATEAVEMAVPPETYGGDDGGESGDAGEGGAGGGSGSQVQDFFAELLTGD